MDVRFDKRRRQGRQPRCGRCIEHRARRCALGGMAGGKVLADAFGAAATPEAVTAITDKAADLKLAAEAQKAEP